MKKEPVYSVYLLIVPALIITACFIEMRFYDSLFMQYYVDYRKRNLFCFLFNFFYGAAAGAIYVLRQVRKQGKWKFSLSRLFLLFFPMAAAGSLFAFFNYQSRIPLPSGIYTPIQWLYYSERLPEHLSYFLSGFFILFPFYKEGERKGRKNKWHANICFLAAMPVLFILNRFTDSYLSSVLALRSGLQGYVIFICAVNVLVGLILGLFIVWEGNGTVPFKEFNFRCFIKKFLPAFITGMIPAVSAVLYPYLESWDCQCGYPFKEEYLSFLIKADFFQLFQILSGYLIVSCFVCKTDSEKEIGGPKFFLSDLIGPVILVAAGYFELKLMPYLAYRNAETIWKIFIFNSAYGLSVGVIYLLKERRKPGRWSIRYPRLCFLFLPMIGVCLYFACFNMSFFFKAIPNLNPFEPVASIAPSPSFVISYYTLYKCLYFGQRLPERAAYFFCSIFLLFSFSKSDLGKPEKKKEWLFCAYCSGLLIALLLGLNLVFQEILRYKVGHSNDLFCYVTAEWAANFMLGFLPGLFFIREIRGTIVLGRFQIKRFFTKCLPVLLLGLLFIAAIFVCNYHSYLMYINPTRGYNDTFATYLIFSGFIQTVQTISGFLFLLCFAKASKPKMQ